MDKYIPVGWVDHLQDELTGEVFQEGTPISQRNLVHMEDGISRAIEIGIEQQRSIDALEAEVKILKDATLNNMTNNVFLENFETIDSVTIASGIYDPVTRRIYV